MTDKSKQRAKDFAQRHNVSHQAAVNQIRASLRDVLNASEQQVEGKLTDVADHYSARVYPKVRFAHVATIEGSGLSASEYRFALQSQLDFVVTDDKRRPLFAIEYDGEGHSMANDMLKNSLCERFELPLGRVNHRHLNLYARDVDSVTWLLEVLFIARAMEEGQANGTYPEDEPIDPFNIISWERNSRSFPLSFTRAVSARLHRLCDAGKLPARYPSHVAYGKGSGVSAMAVVRVADGKFLAARESIYLDGFPIGPGEIATELAVARLGLLLTAYLKGEDVALPATTVYERLNQLASRGDYLGGAFSHDPEGFTVAHAKGETRIVPPAALRQ
jgi:hypothetical protein